MLLRTRSDWDPDQVVVIGVIILLFGLCITLIAGLVSRARLTSSIIRIDVRQARELFQEIQVNSTRDGIDLGPIEPERVLVGVYESRC